MYGDNPDISFESPLTLISQVSRYDLGMIWKSGKHSQISKYFRVPYIKIDEGER